MKSLLVSSAVIGGAGAIILDIPKVYENVLSLIIGNNPEAGFHKFHRKHRWLQYSIRFVLYAAYNMHRHLWTN